MATTPESYPSLLAPREIRKESRIIAALPVTVDFADDIGPQPVCTYDVSRNGARIARPWGTLEVDQTFWLMREKRRALHRVVWIGRAGSERRGQIGVECIQDGRRIWDEDLQKALLDLDEAGDLAPSLAVDPDALIFMERASAKMARHEPRRRQTRRSQYV